MSAKRENKASSRREYVVGIDEAGRGPIAGPVCVGLVIWNKEDEKSVLKELDGIRDSKKMTERQREDFFFRIRKLKMRSLLDYSYSMMSAEAIDNKGIVLCLDMSIYQGIKRICSRADSMNRFATNTDSFEILLDGALKAPKKFKKQKTIIDGDNLAPIISVASVIAKVVRDRKMKKIALDYPNYGFEKHKGYGTERHYERIIRLGLCPEHRRSFLKRLKD